MTCISDIWKKNNQLYLLDILKTFSSLPGINIPSIKAITYFTSDSREHEYSFQKFFHVISSELL